MIIPRIAISSASQTPTPVLTRSHAGRARTRVTLLAAVGAALSGCTAGATPADPSLIHEYGDTVLHNVTNIYAYDANGNPLQGVQLVDQNGQPIRLERREVGPVVPYLNSNGEAADNVYPYRGVIVDYQDLPGADHLTPVVVGQVPAPEGTLPPVTPFPMPTPGSAARYDDSGNEYFGPGGLANHPHAARSN